jgi:hypothetical protein
MNNCPHLTQIFCNKWLGKKKHPPMLGQVYYHPGLQVDLVYGIHPLLSSQNEEAVVAEAITINPKPID